MDGNNAMKTGGKMCKFCELAEKDPKRPRYSLKKNPEKTRKVIIVHNDSNKTKQSPPGSGR